MPGKNATAIAHPNIALIKYWGDIDPNLHLPMNGSISMNLAELLTRTSVNFEAGLTSDQFILDGKQITGIGFERAKAFLDRVRKLSGIDDYAKVESTNNFPMGTGIASSASGFAALSLAATQAAGLKMDERSLSRLARTGSGSACRSIPAGFVEWTTGEQDEDSYAYSIAPPDHWELADCIAIVSQEEKQVSSMEGHSLAVSSVLQTTRVADTPRRLALCLQAILEKDFEKLAEVVELDSNLMHSVMITSNPPLLYWQPGTLSIMQAVQSMRKAGLPACYTIDAGPNVHVLCTADVSGEVVNQLRELPEMQNVILTHPGKGASIAPD